MTDLHHQTLVRDTGRQSVVLPDYDQALVPAVGPDAGVKQPRQIVDFAGVESELVLGVPVSLLDVAEASALLAERAADRNFEYLVTPNAQHMVRLRNGDADFIAGYEAAGLRLVDSQILRLLMRLLFRMDLPLASGSNLTARLFQEVIRPDDAITVIGGGDELATRLRDQFGLTALSLYNPPMGFISNPVEVDRCVRFVEENPARFVFLVVGAPKSEKLARMIRDRGIATGMGLCVGSSLLFITGMVPRAPRWVSRFALEWAFRLALNPRGHFRRVFVESLPLLGMALRARLRGSSRGKPLFPDVRNSGWREPAGAGQ